MNSQKHAARGAEALFAAAFTYAFTGVLVREMEPMWGDKAQVAIRWILVFLFLALYDFFKRIKATVPAGKLGYVLALGIVFPGTVMFFTFSIQKTTLANTLFTFYAMNMVASFLLGTFLLKEKVSRVKILAILFALAGLSLYADALAAGSLGIIFAVIAGMIEGLANVIRKRLAGVDRNAILRIQYGIGAIFTSLVTLISRDEIIRTVSLRVTILTVIFAVVLIAAGNLLLYGYQHFDVNIGTVITSTELVFGALLGWLLFQEIPAPHELLGGGLILAGSIVGSGIFNKGKPPVLPVAQPD
jgi:drug/metabolite transporter (DMT)-like permease